MENSLKKKHYFSWLRLITIIVIAAFLCQNLVLADTYQISQSILSKSTIAPPSSFTEHEVDGSKEEDKKELKLIIYDREADGSRGPLAGCFYTEEEFDQDRLAAIKHGIIVKRIGGKGVLELAGYKEQLNKEYENYPIEIHIVDGKIIEVKVLAPAEELLTAGRMLSDKIKKSKAKKTQTKRKKKAPVAVAAEAEDEASNDEDSDVSERVDALMAIFNPETALKDRFVTKEEEEELIRRAQDGASSKIRNKALL